MQEIMERYKQELYNYHQRSRTSPEVESPAVSTAVEPVVATAAVVAESDLTKTPEVKEVFAPAAQNPSASSETEPDYRQADAVLSESQMETPPSATLPNIEAPAEQEEETSKLDEFEMFQEENPGTGTLKVQVYTARRAIPIANASVYVTKDFNDQPHVFFSSVTDADGIIDGIQLPAPSRQESQQPEETPPYANYDIYVDAAGYRPEAFKDVPIFDGVQSIQPVNMTPSNGMELPPEIIVEEEPDL